MFLILFLLTLTSLIVWDYLFRKHRNRIIKAAGMKGPKPTLPFIGDAMNFFRNDTNTTLFNTLDDMFLVYGKVIRLWLGHRLFLFVKDPAYFQAILKRKDTIKKSYLYEMFSVVLGDSILLSFGAKWHATKKIIAPAFSFNILEDFFVVFERQSEILVKHLNKRADGETALDIYPQISAMGLDGIIETAMGLQINAQDNPDLPYIRAITAFTNIAANRLIKPLQFTTLGFMLTSFSSYLETKQQVKIIKKFTDKVISDRIALKDNNTSSISNNNTNDDIGQKKRMCFLDILLEAEIDGQPLKYNEIRDEVITFLIAGSDTTASAIAFCLHLLARHADIQEKLFQEIITVIGPDKDKPVTMNDMHELKYMDLVIKETLRLYPSLPFIGRHIETDVQVDENTIIPANTNVILMIYNVQRDPDNFDKPNDFIPERYNSEEPNSTNNFTNIPFSAGIRNCIGMKYGLLEMKNVLSKMLRYFELLPLGPDVEPVLNIVLRSANGMQLGLKPRKY